MCDYCFPPHNPRLTFSTETMSVAAGYPSIKPPPPGVPVNAIAATQILLDLIAESRLWLTGDNPEPLGLVLARAEARLRELDTRPKLANERINLGGEQQMGDVCDVCEAPATFWRRHGEPVDRCDRHAPSAENILLDLIADLRADGVGHAEDNFMLGQCKSCEERWPCVLVQHADMAVRAEVRLREVGGHE